MQLTEEQAEVVALASGRHLVLAPPGSGKTEMLSRRIFSAIRRGVDPDRMLCATFTNRAAFEMRERVAREADNLRLPDVGNIHHFCHSFLVSVGRMHSPAGHRWSRGKLSAISSILVSRKSASRRLIGFRHSASCAGRAS